MTNSASTSSQAPAHASTQDTISAMSSSESHDPRAQSAVDSNATPSSEGAAPEPSASSAAEPAVSAPDSATTSTSTPSTSDLSDDASTSSECVRGNVSAAGKSSIWVCGTRVSAEECAAAASSAYGSENQGTSASAAGRGTAATAEDAWGSDSDGEEQDSIYRAASGVDVASYDAEQGGSHGDGRDVAAGGHAVGAGVEASDGYESEDYASGGLDTWGEQNERRANSRFHAFRHRQKAQRVSTSDTRVYLGGRSDNMCNTSRRKARSLKKSMILLIAPFVVLWTAIMGVMEFNMHGLRNYSEDLVIADIPGVSVSDRLQKDMLQVAYHVDLLAQSMNITNSYSNYSSLKDLVNAPYLNQLCKEQPEIAKALAELRVNIDLLYQEKSELHFRTKQVFNTWLAYYGAVENFCILTGQIGAIYEIAMHDHSLIMHGYTSLSKLISRHTASLNTFIRPQCDVVFSYFEEHPEDISRFAERTHVFARHQVLDSAKSAAAITGAAANIHEIHDNERLELPHTDEWIRTERNLADRTTNSIDVVTGAASATNLKPDDRKALRYPSPSTLAAARARASAAKAAAAGTAAGAGAAGTLTAGAADPRWQQDLIPEDKDFDCHIMFASDDDLSVKLHDEASSSPEADSELEQRLALVNDDVERAVLKAHQEHEAFYEQQQRRTKELLDGTQPEDAAAISATHVISESLEAESARTPSDSATYAQEELEEEELGSDPLEVRLDDEPNYDPMMPSSQALRDPNSEADVMAAVNGHTGPTVHSGQLNEKGELDEASSHSAVVGDGFSVADAAAAAAGTSTAAAVAGAAGISAHGAGAGAASHVGNKLKLSNSGMSRNEKFLFTCRTYTHAYEDLQALHAEHTQAMQQFKKIYSDVLAGITHIRHLSNSMVKKPVATVAQEVGHATVQMSMWMSIMFAAVILSIVYGYIFVLRVFVKPTRRLLELVKEFSDTYRVPDPREVSLREEQEILATLQPILHNYGSLVQNNIDLKRLNTKLGKLYYLDGLTHLYNRQALDEISAQIPMLNNNSAVLLTDIDHLFDYNVAHGRVAGDDAIALIASTIKSNIAPEKDLLFRYSGDEFCLVLSQISYQETIILCDHLLQKIEELELKYKVTAPATTSTAPASTKDDTSYEGVAAESMLEGVAASFAAELSEDLTDKLKSAYLRSKNTRILTISIGVSYVDDQMQHKTHAVKDHLEFARQSLHQVKERSECSSFHVFEIIPDLQMDVPQRDESDYEPKDTHDTAESMARRNVLSKLAPESNGQ